jgi:DNA-binding NtrC family response regulator
MTTKKTVLLVDDDIDQLEILGIYLNNMGFNTIKIDTQKEAENYIKNNKPDLAILDIMMEREDSGFVLAYQLKKAHPDVPVIIVTAVASETGIPFNLENNAGKNWIKADLFLQKNIRQDQLQREINKLLKTENSIL